MKGLYRVKNQEGADVILQICEGGVAGRTIDLFRVHIPLELHHSTQNRFIESLHILHGHNQLMFKGYTTVIRSRTYTR